MLGVGDNSRSRFETGLLRNSGIRESADVRKGAVHNRMKKRFPKGDEPFPRIRFRILEPFGFVDVGTSEFLSRKILVGVPVVR